MSDFRIASIVEGYGEIQSLPILIRRVAAAHDPPKYPKTPVPIRVSASQFLLLEDEFSRTLKLAERITEGTGAIFILLDCDDGCPAIEGPKILHAAQAVVGHIPVAVCLAYREFETWFLASATSLRGQRTLPHDLVAPESPETIRGAKGWIERKMGKPKYSPRLDQPALTASFDIEVARRIDSFDKFCREVSTLLSLL